jgi:hypothetical protein
MALYAAFALDAISLVFTTLVFGHHWFGTRLFLAWDGFGLAAMVLAIYGALELAGRFAGAARAGAIIVVIANGAMLVLQIGLATYFDFKHTGPDWLLAADRYAWDALFVAEAVGWTIAAWRVLPVAIPCGLVTLVMAIPREAFGDHASVKLDLVLRGLHWFALAMLVLFAARGITRPTPRRAAAGLRRAGASLVVRVVAAVVGTGTLVMFGVAGGRDQDVLRVGLLAGAGISAVALVLFATGLLDAARATLPGLPRWLLAVAATAALWVTGVATRQLPALYIALYRPEDSGHSDAMETAQALPIITLLVMTVAIVALLIAIASKLRAEAAS